MESKIRIIFPLILLLILSHVTRGWASELVFSLGYDSEPAAQEGRGDSSAFEMIEYEITKTRGDFTLLTTGFFKEYLSAPEAFYHEFRLLFSQGTLKRFGEFSGGINFYRNGLVTEDEFNGAFFAFSLNYLLAANLVLSLDLELERRHYLHFDTVRRFRKRKKTSMREKEAFSSKFSRRETSYFFKTGVSWAGKNWNHAGGLFFLKNDSTFPLEAYHGLGLEYLLSYQQRKLLLTFSFKWQALDYLRAPRREDRKDYVTDYSWELSYFLSKKKYLYLEIWHQNHKSPVAVEDYQRSIFRCGFGFYF